MQFILRIICLINKNTHTYIFTVSSKLISIRSVHTNILVYLLVPIKANQNVWLPDGKSPPNRHIDKQITATIGYYCSPAKRLERNVVQVDKLTGEVCQLLDATLHNVILYAKLHLLSMTCHSSKYLKTQASFFSSSSQVCFPSSQCTTPCCLNVGELKCQAGFNMNHSAAQAVHTLCFISYVHFEVLSPNPSP